MQNLTIQPKQQPKYKVVWEPLPGSQTRALSCPAQQILYYGTRGPGKTDTQLMRFARNVGKGYKGFWKGIIFDREYKSLEDLIKKSQRWFREIWNEDEAWFLASVTQLKWVWATGEELLFRVIDDPKDYFKYHGQEYAFMGWNELTQWPTSECYDIMQSCNRTSFTPEKDSPRDEDGNIIELLPPIPLENFATTNSFGEGHFWVKDRFITAAKPGVIIIKNTRVFSPSTKTYVTVQLTQCAIFGAWWENPYLDDIYIAKLQGEKDPNLRKSWFEGSWDITAGGAFDDIWRLGIHVVPRFKLPPEWRLIDRSYDDGGAHPFSVGWWVEANGEEVEIPLPTAPGEEYGANGFIKWCPESGSLIQLGEIYGMAEDAKFGDNRGNGWGSKRIAQEINTYEATLIAEGWVSRVPMPGPADNRIRAKDPDKDTPAQIMEAEGVEWEESDKSAGSRQRDFKLFRDRLWASRNKDGPGLYFMDNCRASITLIPSLPRDKRILDDVNTKSEDHTYDMARYRCAKGNLNTVTGEIQFGFAH